ncbi:MAG: DNA polymerase III subunit epsilon [Alphaproteobacteria bacterium]|nr:DNA polymerase III subunit epsilon [Alphaproteobacteria bacterium]
MREIVLDTETTGLDPIDGHRIIEIGCVELIDYLPTGLTLQHYLNPERQVGDSERVHGIADAFLADKPLFAQIADELLEFLGDSRLIMHNAGFDMKFLNFELRRLARPTIPFARAIDTIEIAKAKLPGARYSLDELCRRFGVDLSSRLKHGALLDAQLTAQIYLELVGGRQTRLQLAPADVTTRIAASEIIVMQVRPAPLLPRLTLDEIAAHIAWVASEIGPEAIWGWG